MHSHLLKKLIKEALYISGCWLFLNKWNNESVITNITRPYNFNSRIEVYPPTNVRKNFVPTKIWKIFKLSLPIIMKKGGRGCRNDVLTVSFVRDDSRFEMGDGKRPLDVRGRGLKTCTLKKFNYRTKCNFSFANMLPLSNPK